MDDYLALSLIIMGIAIGASCNMGRNEPRIFPQKEAPRKEDSGADRRARSRRSKIPR